MTRELLEQLLAPQAFQPCTSIERHRTGWVSPRDNGQLVHAVQRQMLIAMATEKKMLPLAVINEVLKARLAELEEQQGFKPGRKQTKELKEQVTDELLPRAFSLKKITRIWIDPVNGWMAVDSSSPTIADEVLKQLLKSLTAFPGSALRTARSPVAAMTDWLSQDEAPAGFTVDQDAELRASREGKPTVRYVRHTIEADDVRRHIAAGKQCTRLAMTWADKISFVLTESLALKRVAILDALKSEGEQAAEDEDARFDADMLLMTDAMNKLLNDLVEAMGGFQQEQERDVTGDAPMPMAA